MTDPQEIFETVQAYIKANYLYDYVKAETVKSGTLPDIDGCYESQMEMCIRDSARNHVAEDDVRRHKPLALNLSGEAAIGGVGARRVVENIGRKHKPTKPPLNLCLLYTSRCV